LIGTTACDNLALTYAAQQLYSEAYEVLKKGLDTLGEAYNDAQTTSYYKMLNETHDAIQVLQTAELAAINDDTGVIDLLEKPLADLRATPTANNYNFFYPRFKALYDAAKPT
jgi:hypothetical protein